MSCLEPRKAGMCPCIAIYKKDYDRHSALRTAQKTMGEMVCDKEQSMDWKKRKQQVMDKLLVFPSKQSVESSVIVSKSGSKEVNTKIVSFFYENCISFNVADSSTFACMIEESMKYAKQNLLLSDTVSTWQVISASACEQNWSIHWHIHTKICNRLDPATTEKLVYVYSNSKLVASTCNADKLKMFAWDNEDVEVLYCLRQGGSGQALGAEALRRLVAYFGARREAQVAAARLSAPLPTMESGKPDSGSRH